MLESFELTFGDAGWEVSTAGSGEEAMERFAAGRFDLVITDKNLPGISGIEVVTQMRMQDSAVTIMMLTGFGSASSAVDTLNAGTDSYIEKPVRDLIRLAARAEATLRRRRQQRSSGLIEGSTPREPFDVLVLCAAPSQSTFIATELAGKVDSTIICPSWAVARPYLSEKPHSLVLVDEGVAHLTYAIGTLRAEFESLPVAVFGQQLGLELIMRLVELGVSTCIVLPLGWAQCSTRVAYLIDKLRRTSV
ncbi:MAG: response regulator [Myxococcales bacterium]|nr:response regulator [Myxococcales bacterium]